MRRSLILGVAAGLAAASAWLPAGARAQAAAFRPRQQFVAPPAGSYALPPIQPATNGWVLDGNWLPRRLSSYTSGALTLLTFAYTYCADPTGCPLAYDTFNTLQQRIAAEPLLRGKVRLVTLSFDPANDTPAAMRQYGHGRSNAAVPWFFLTTYSVRFLSPILDGFGQDVEIEHDERGNPTRAITHLLKVFLIDRAGQVREIYTTAFLLPEVMLNDLRTLAMEAATSPPQLAHAKP